MNDSEKGIYDMSTLGLGGSGRRLVEKSFDVKLQEYLTRTKSQMLAGTIFEVEKKKRQLAVLNEALEAEIERRRATEERIKFMASHDDLTGLPNRTLFRDRITVALANARRHKTGFSVFFVDLDGFKAVNDTLGHKAGDELLIEVAERLTECVRDNDTVARLGGDEFAVVIVDMEVTGAAEVVARKILNALSEPFIVADEKAGIGASIGIAVYPENGDTPDKLLNAADEAMYAVKEAGKNDFRVA